LPKLLAAGSVIGILTIVSLAGFANASILAPYSESTITVKESEVYCTYNNINPAVVVKDQAGNIITQTTVNTQVLIEATVNLDCNTADEPLTTIIEVRDKQGSTTYLAWQMVPISSSQQIITGLSWMPDKPGEYDVRFFPMVCLQCPMVLSHIVTYKITVV